MTETILLVDFENVGKVDLKAIPDGIRVWVFFGSADKKVPIELFDAALDMKDRFARIKIEGQGKNALDFHIAFYLGELLHKEPNTKCVILSKDKGFDPLVKHLVGRHFDVARVASLAEIAKPAKPAPKAPAAKPASQKPTAVQPPSAADPFDQVVQWITSMDKKKRPRKRKGLVAHVYNHFSKKISEETVQSFIDRLIAQNRLTETNGAIAYNL